MSSTRFALGIPAFALHSALGVQAALLLYASGRPLFTDDLWWHLALGRAFLAGGPWLAADPSLHTAPGPPDGAHWWAPRTLLGAQRPPQSGSHLALPS